MSGAERIEGFPKSEGRSNLPKPDPTSSVNRTDRVLPKENGKITSYFQ